MLRARFRVAARAAHVLDLRVLRSAHVLDLPIGLSTRVQLQSISHRLFVRLSVLDITLLRPRFGHAARTCLQPADSRVTV
jgi:hypothetical protein